MPGSATTGKVLFERLQVGLLALGKLPPGHIKSDRIEPSAKGRLGPKLINLIDGAQQRVLHDILSVLFVASQTAHHAIYLGLMQVDQRYESIKIALLGFPY